MAGYDSRTGGLLASVWIGYSLLFWFYPLAWLLALSLESTKSDGFCAFDHFALEITG